MPHGPLFLFPTANAVRFTGHPRKSSGFQSKTENILRRVGVGVFSVAAFQTQEFGLRPPVILVDVAADAASLAGVGGRHSDKPGAMPSRLVFQHLADLRRRDIQHGAVETCLGPDIAARFLDGSRRAGRHVAHLQILDDDKAVVFGNCRRRLVGGILAPPRQFRLKPGNGHLGLPPVLGAFVPPRQPLLQGCQLAPLLLAGARQHDQFAGRKDEWLGNSQVDSHGRAEIRQWIRRLDLALDRDMPAIRLTADRGRFRLAFHRAMLGPIHPPGLGQENPLRRDFELLRIGIAEAVAVTTFAEFREAGATVEEIPERLFQIDDRLLKRVIGSVTQPGRFILERREFLNLVIGGQASRIAAMPFQATLLKAKIVDEPARADRLPKQGFLFGAWIQAIAVCLERNHAMSIIGLTHGGKRMDTEYRRGRSVVFALHVHLVFVTKYRRGVFTDRVHVVLKDAFLGVCAEFDAVLKEVNGEDDHVHLLIEYPPTVQLSKLVNSLKGVSSRRLRQQNFPEVKRKLWGNHLWSPSYFAASCGGAPLEIVKQYIEQQREGPPEKKEGKTRLSRP